MAVKSSAKRLQIDKANSTVVIVAAISSFIVVFSLVASKALLSQRTYQSHVISKKEQARDQLKANVSATTDLVNKYNTFIGESPNIIGGNASGQGNNDGNNAQIVLDALPSSYDFPAVTSSLEKILNQGGLSLKNITGTDDGLSQETKPNGSAPQPVAIPFQVTITGSYDAIQQYALKVFENSIRPINVSDLTITGTASSLSATIQAQTYYQPESGLTISKVVVK